MLRMPKISQCILESRLTFEITPGRVRITHNIYTVFFPEHFGVIRAFNVQLATRLGDFQLTGT